MIVEKNVKRTVTGLQSQTIMLEHMQKFIPSPPYKVENRSCFEFCLKLAEHLQPWKGFIGRGSINEIFKASTKKIEYRLLRACCYVYKVASVNDLNPGVSVSVECDCPG